MEFKSFLFDSHYQRDHEESNGYFDQHVLIGGLMGADNSVNLRNSNSSNNRYSFGVGGSLDNINDHLYSNDDESTSSSSGEEEEEFESDNNSNSETVYTNSSTSSDEEVDESEQQNKNNNNNNNNNQFSLTNNWFVNTFFKRSDIINSNNSANSNNSNNSSNNNKQKKQKKKKKIKRQQVDIKKNQINKSDPFEILNNNSSNNNNNNSDENTTTTRGLLERMILSQSPLSLLIKDRVILHHQTMIPIIDTYTAISSSSSSSLSTSTDTSSSRSSILDDNDLDRINKSLMFQLSQQDNALNNSNNNNQGNNQLITKCIDCLNTITDIDKIIFLDCTHIYCRTCLYQFIRKRIDEKRVSKIKCRCCKTPLSVYDIKQVLTNEEYSVYDDASLSQAITRNKDSYIQCPSCDLFLEKIIVPTNSNLKTTSTTIIEYDENGKKLSRESIEHKRKFRFRCPQCSCIFCTECLTHPYHLGYTCAQFQIYSTSKHCRFCKVAIFPILASPRSSLVSPYLNNNYDNSICSNDECISKSIKSCQKTLKCGHDCIGIINESKCFPCIHPDCSSIDEVSTPPPISTVLVDNGTTTTTTTTNTNISTPLLIKEYKTNQKSNDYCNICWTDSLSSEPCIQLECGHIFHKKCCSSVLKKRWTSSRISFGFIKCALCSQNMEHPSLEKHLTPINELYNTIKSKALHRLTLFGVEKGINLDDPSSKWYQNKEGYVMDRFSYFMCHKCKKPYFGGEKVCGVAEQNNNENDENGDYKAEELVCGGCSSNGNENCKKHGKEFIEYKCKYCCRISAFFCWGTTHFCIECHRNVNQVTQQPPVCKCGRNCSDKILNTSCFGCSLCRIISDE